MRTRCVFDTVVAILIAVAHTLMRCGLLAGGMAVLQ